MTKHAGSTLPIAELELLASAVAGRGITLALGRHGTYTTGSVIHLGADATNRNEQCQHVVIAQATLIAVGSLSSSCMRRLSRSRAGSARRYLGLEVVRACRELREELPGTFQSAVQPFAARVGVTGSADESLLRAVGRNSFDDVPAWFGDLRPLSVLRASRTSGGQPLSDAELAQAIRAATEPEHEKEEEGERSGILEKLASPIRSPLGTAFQRMLGARRSSGGEGMSGSGVTVVQHHTGTAPTARPSAAALPPATVSAGGQLTRGAIYPEWDYMSSTYRARWCTVGHFDPTQEVETSPPTGGVHQVLLRELARVGLSWRPHDAEPFGDELDLTALVDYQVAVAAGTSGEPRVYRAERRTAQEIGALILLDATSSTAEQQAGHVIFEEQRDLVYDLTTALDQLGARVETYAFYSRGRENIRFLRCKTFEERWGLTAQRRLFSIRPTGFTRLGGAIRHGIHLLDTQAGTQHRLLVVVGDSVPYEDGYEGKYAVADTRRAIDEARDRAVGCVGLSTRLVPESSEIWSQATHRVTATTTELAAEAYVLFGNALRCAGRGRTIHHLRSAS